MQAGSVGLGFMGYIGEMDTCNQNTIKIYQMISTCIPHSSSKERPVFADVCWFACMFTAIC